MRLEQCRSKVSSCSNFTIDSHPNLIVTRFWKFDSETTYKWKSLCVSNFVF